MSDVFYEAEMQLAL